MTVAVALISRSAYAQGTIEISQALIDATGDFGIIANLNSSIVRNSVMGNRLGGMSLSAAVVFSDHHVLDNSGVDPVFSGIDTGDNNRTNASGVSAGC
jgi:hypothetical protein